MELTAPAEVQGQAGAAVGVRQARSGRLREGPRRPRRRDRLAPAAPLARAGARRRDPRAGRGLHRLPGDPRRPGQDAQPEDLRRPAGGALEPGARRRRSTSTTIEPIDLVCVNLYPFESVAGMRGVSEDEVIENIDIGGPTLIRAAAKNHPFAVVVVRPESYDAVLEELRDDDCRIEERTREALAMEAFSYTARYDAAISRWFAEREDDVPDADTRVRSTKVLDLSYGENPHQRAAYYQQNGRALAPALDGVEAPRQGAVVQQPARPRRGAEAPRGVRGADGGDHQAQQPVRHRGRQRRSRRRSTRRSPPTR